ncbi:hypothetical protein DFH07DRAFT_957292 [Mycena maculata]|uniref:DUF6532 domain-containing protein n=1 Tax=Mycena maculata TaxID=230809 RepID=A0AAD7JBN4_9AGAR|nr:hypothetical protein DFH07DRAFT_957275 [Mycena maculata]KAJ7761204.1 hypothetical protein DFH07DRAFT_957278 [Mycena maculata]KAJ7761221.1 hypothetical protein DFH07DRAFT_957292 [Mycena maculata]
MRPTTRGRSSTRQDTANKENLKNQVSHRQIAVATTAKKSKGQETFEDSDNDNDADNNYTPPRAVSADSEDDDDEDPEDDDDDNESPVRGRTRRVSEKQAQLLQEEQDALERKRAKAAKAIKAAKKKAGEVEEDTRGPINDEYFTSRTVESRPKTTKNLAQRNSRVPKPPKFPSTDWRVTDDAASARGHGHSHSSQVGGFDNDTQDHHLESPVRARQTFCDRSPSPERRPVRAPLRNINGGIVPERATLHLVQDTPPDHPCSFPRSTSPDAGEKRPRSPSDDSEDMRSTQSPRTSTSGRRPRARDFDDRTKEYISFAIDLYRCYLSAKLPFPEHLDEGQLVRRAWDAACAAMGERLTLTPTVSKLISNRGPHMRGELKTKVKAFAEVMYGFKAGNNKKTIAFNRKRAEDLKEGSTFAFKNIKEKKGLYKHPILQKTANVMWFANRRDEGVVHPEFFSPFPVTALALILTVVENTIDEYLTGIRTDVPFTANDYRSVYETHLKSLEEFREHTSKYLLLDKILLRMHNIGRFHSGAQPIAAVTTSALSKEVLDAALKEYEEDDETESDGENGEYSNADEQ